MCESESPSGSKPTSRHRPEVARSSRSNGISTAAARRPFAEDGIDGTESTMHVATSGQLDKPGTYFPSVRVTAHRDGDVNASQRRLVNLGRVRVVVSDA